jgi:hypothetical protein
MSADHTDQQYRLDQLDTVSLSELQTLYRKVVHELSDTKLEFEEFQCK